MCGIAGYFGSLAPSSDAVHRTLSVMKNRGPDFSDHLQINTPCGQLAMLHSRLSILDLDSRSHQPFKREGCFLIFNGEIYNYIELRNELEKKGHKFDTTSDTEVLLRGYLQWGEDCVTRFEGMWAFALYDSRINKLYLSRDRFAEKPLYLFKDQSGVYFGSEVKFLSNLSGKKFTVNRRHILRYLVNGYKSLYKSEDTFFEEICELPRASWAELGADGLLKCREFWKPQVRSTQMTLSEAIEGVRTRVLESIRIRLRSDVPLAFCLSGGVDSGTIVSVAAKNFGCDVSCYSIIDPDERYNEAANIDATVKDLGCKNTVITLEKERGIDGLRELIAYHDAPIATITYYIHSFLSKKIAADGFKVVFSGTASDELFTGYYDHYNLHLYELKDKPEFQKCLDDWNQYMRPIVRNPFLQNPMLYVDNPGERRHIYLNNDEFISYLKVPFDEGFVEKSLTDSPLRNRMLNELFYEATRVILHEDDLNSMKYSLENRSPFLDSSLLEFAYSIPAEYLIRDGYGKYLLRQAMQGILNDQVRLDRQKKGFNASIFSVFDLKHSELQELLLSESPIYELVDRKKVERIINQDHLENSFSKYLFNFINTKIFMELHQ